MRAETGALQPGERFLGNAEVEFHMASRADVLRAGNGRQSI